MSRFRVVLVVLMLQGLLPSVYVTAQNTPRLSVEQTLTNMAEAFRTKIEDDYSFRAQINIQPALESGDVDTRRPALQTWHVVVSPGKNVLLTRGADDSVQIVFYTTEHALRLMSEGRMNSITATMVATSKDPSPLRWERPKTVQITPELRANLRYCHHFFDTSVPHRTVLDAAHSRTVHGASVVGLYYYPGFRSAWYEVRKGKRLNEPGDTNPFPQAFIFISGEGMAKIGDKTIEVKSGEAYFIPPNTDHIVWTDSNEPLVLIWLAWGEKA